MNELKVIDFKYGDWRDWFLTEDTKWGKAEKSRLFATINNKEFSVIAPVNINEITISYLHQSGEPKFLNSFGYKDYSIMYLRSSTNNCADRLDITIEFTSFKYIDSKYNKRE